MARYTSLGLFLSYIDSLFRSFFDVVFRVVGYRADIKGVTIATK